MHSTLISGFVTKVSSINPNKHERVVYLEAGYIDIPEINRLKFKNTILVTIDFWNPDKPISPDSLLHKNIAISNCTFNVAYISDPDAHDYVKYMQKYILKNTVSKITVINDKLLPINFCHTDIKIEKKLSGGLQGFHSCTITSENIFSPYYNFLVFGCKDLTVLVKDSAIKPEIGKSYSIMGHIVNFPREFSREQGKHGIYAELVREITNADRQNQSSGSL